MEDSIPNNIFIDEALEHQINAIKSFRDNLRMKYSEEFDREEIYIALDFEGIPSYRAEDGKSRISFIPHYSPQLPIYIKEEFEAHLAKHLIK